LLVLGVAPRSTESAIANGDTRTLSFSSSHTNESGTFTYRVNGYYDQAVLDKLNWFMRDWRLNEPTKMDPKLFDIIWEVYRQSGSSQPIDVLSGYRSPQTNAMLRRRSRQVAEHSQHMEGKAIDAHFLDVSPGTIRDIAMRMQSGGVGFYPIGSTPWVHIDSGSVRYWPRMSRVALTHLFPDGKTVFIPSDGQPMAGYEQARAEIEARGGEVLTASNTSPGFFAWLFGARGGGADDAEEGDGEVVVGRGGLRSTHASVQVASATPDPIASARKNIPRGATFLQAPAPDPVGAPTTVLADVRSGGVRAAVPVETARAAPPPPVEPTPQLIASASQTDPVADADPEVQFIAPLPPRKPSDLMQSIVVDAPAPLPPTRPTEFVVASADDRPVDATSDDLIAALLRHGRLPGEITRGLKSSASSALALADPGASTRARDDAAALLRAAALNAPLPPLPPPRPTARLAGKDGGITNASRATSAPARAGVVARVPGSAQAAPYGGMVVDAFNVEGVSASPDPERLADGLRGSSP
jgi:uncharacterized protein YcbK (DUF882 family)